MKKGILYSIIVLVVLAGSAAAYWWGFRTPMAVAEMRELVPEHAVVVYGSQQIQKDWQALQEHPMGEVLNRLPFYQQVQEGYAYLDSLGSGISFSTAWLRQPSYISLHRTGSNGFDFIFYADLGGKVGRESLKDIQKHFEARADLRYKQREFEGRTIHQFQSREGKAAFYYFMEGPYFVGSFTGYLLEDVIRHLGSGAQAHFFAQHPGLQRTQSEGGQWWVNLRQWPELMKVFLPADEEPRWPTFGDFLHLDWVFGDKVLLWSGLAPQGVLNEPQEFLDVLQTQNNGRFRLPEQLPARTAWAFHWQLNQGADYLKAMYQYQQHVAPALNREREAFANRFLLDYEDFVDYAGPEAAMMVLESVNVADPDRLIVLQSKEITRSVGWLNNLATKVGETSLDSLYLEAYLGQEIRLADVYNLPAFILGKPFEGFQQTFYSSRGDYLILGNTAQGIRRLLEDWNNGEVLGKSVRSAVFLENTLQEGVCGWMLQSPRAWSHGLETLNADWKQFFASEGLVWRGLSHGSIQFRKADKNWFTSVALQPEVNKVEPGDRRFTTRLSHQFDSPLQTPPFVVRNHNSGARETLVQDAQNYLYLLDTEGNTLWRDSLSESIVSDLKQIDFFKNGKLQYFFVTPTQLHIVDREGKPVGDFPTTLPAGEKAEFAQVIDYDGSKNYRFAVATESGKVYLYDKNGFPLEGWNPRDFGAPMSQRPFHVRVRGIDRMVFTLANGTVAVTNRRGEMQSGFPVDVRGKLSSPLFVQEGTDLDNTFFSAVTEEGELVTFTMAGKVAERKQLYKPTREAKFSLVPDVLGQTFLIGRMSEGQIGFLDAKGDELFNKDFLTSGRVMGQFYRFGAGKELILVTDLDQEFAYVLDYEGNLVNYRPLNNGELASVLYYDGSNTFHIYTVFEDEFSVSTFQP